MARSLVTKPTGQPLQLEDAKLQLRVPDEVEDEDRLIGDLISTATEYVENFVHRRLLSQTWSLTLCGFPPVIELPWPPVTSVVITYLDANGATQTLAASTYDTDLPSGPYALYARVIPKYGYTWPVTYPSPSAVTITFVCGYGKESDVPWSVKAAIKMMVLHLYDAGRQPIVVQGGTTAAVPVPKTIDELLWPYKAFEVAA